MKFHALQEACRICCLIYVTAFSSKSLKIKRSSKENFQKKRKETRKEKERKEEVRDQKIRKEKSCN